MGSSPQGPATGERWEAAAVRRPSWLVRMDLRASRMASAWAALVSRSRYAWATSGSASAAYSASAMDFTPLALATSTRLALSALWVASVSAAAWAATAYSWTFV